MTLKFWNPCPTEGTVWDQYTTALSSAPGTVKIGKKEWRDGFGAVLSDDGTYYKLTGARVDDNGLTKFQGGAVKASYTQDKNNELYTVLRSMELQTHLTTTGSYTDEAPTDPDWHVYGMDDITFTDPTETNLNELQVYRIQCHVNFTHAMFVIQYRGDELDASRGYIEYRVQGTTEWIRGPQLGAKKGNSVDAATGAGGWTAIERHLSGPIVRLAPGTVYEWRATITDVDAALGDSTSWSNPLVIDNSYTFKTRHQPYAPKDGTASTISTRAALMSDLAGTETIAGGHVTISAGDYTLAADENSGTPFEINVSGTPDRPLLIEGDGEVIVPKMKVTGSDVIIHNIKVCNRDSYIGDYDQNDTSSKCINIPASDSDRIVLSKVDMHWHADMPQTWEEGYRENRDYDLKRFKIYGIPVSGSGPNDPSPVGTVVENCDLWEGPKKNLSDIAAGTERITEWQGNEGFDIRHQGLTLRNNTVYNNYDNSLTGTGSGTGLSSFAMLDSNLFYATHDDVLELEKAKGGTVLIDNIVAGVNLGNWAETGATVQNHRTTNRVVERTVTSAVEVDEGNVPTGGGANTGRWLVTTSEDLPLIGSGNDEPLYGPIWQNGKVWKRVDLSNSNFTNPFLVTAELNTQRPGNSDIYATNSDVITTGTITVGKANKQPFPGAATISAQQDIGTIPLFFINHQMTGNHDTTGADSPLKFKGGAVASFLGCFFTTFRGCHHVWKPGDKGGMYFANTTFTNSQCSYTNKPTFTSANVSLGDWTGTQVYRHMQDYNAYYSNTWNDGTNGSYGYWNGKQLASMQADWGTELNSHDYKDLADAETDFALQISYRNMWNETARRNRNDLHFRPYYQDLTSESSQGPAAYGSYKPLQAIASATSRNYGTGLPASDPAARLCGPSILSTDDVSFMGVPNKTEDRIDVAPTQALIGEPCVGPREVKNYEQYKLPEGWVEQSTGNTALMTNLGITPTGTVKGFFTNADETVGLIVER